MSLDDQELRERCLNLAANAFKSPGITGQQLTTVADHFFQYIKNGDDTEYDVEDEPTPPVNMGPGLEILRGLPRIHDAGFSYTFRCPNDLLYPNKVK